MPGIRKRVGIPAATKKTVFKRDGGVCRVCGMGEADGVAIEYDHITPWAHGGSNAASNLQLLCQRHNNERGQSVRTGAPARVTLLRRDALDADVVRHIMTKTMTKKAGS